MDISRRPCLAKYFSADAAVLLREIQECYTHRQHGPGGGGGTLLLCQTSAFCPILTCHGAFQDGGVVAAHAYRHFADAYSSSPLPKVLVLIGNSHWPLAQTPPVVLTQQIYQTPLGSLPQAAPQLLQSLSNHLPVDNAAHAREHSIENQLPFIQQMYSERKQNSPVILPLLVGNNSWTHAEELEPVAELIAQKVCAFAREHSSTVGLIGTTDFSHVGPFYRELPPRGTSTIEYTTQVDKKVIAELLGKGDLEQFVALGSRTSACGIWSAALTFLVAKKMRERMGVPHPAEGARLLKYAVASEIFPNENVTGFASIAL